MIIKICDYCNGKITGKVKQFNIYDNSKWNNALSREMHDTCIDRAVTEVRKLIPRAEVNEIT